MTFLANMLREEGGFEYKKAIVNTIISIVEENPEAKEAGRSAPLDRVPFRQPRSTRSGSSV